MAEPGRLRRKRDFERTFAEGAHVRGPLMKLAVAVSPPAAAPPSAASAPAPSAAATDAPPPGAASPAPSPRGRAAAPAPNEIRLGTAVSRRVSRRAVRRNRVRRRLREAFRLAAPALPPGYDVVCIPYQTDKDPEPPFATLVDSFDRLIREAIAKLERRKAQLRPSTRCARS